jgi:hypothetical protein
MKILIQLFSRFGIVAILVGLLGYILPVFGLQFRNAGYLEYPGAKLNTIIAGLLMLSMAFLISLINQKKR